MMHTFRRALMLRIRAFAFCESGSAAIEFVTMLPLTVIILIIGAEYGNGLMTREALDSALRDATRIISRAPLKDLDSGEGTVPGVYPYFEQTARQIIADRTGRPIEQVTFSVTATEEATNVELRKPLIIIETTATIGVEMPLLGYLNDFAGASGEDELVSTFITLSAADRARYVGELDVGQLGCSPANRSAGLCP